MCLAFLGLLHGAILFAGFLAPQDPEAQNRNFPFAPPARLRLIDSRGSFHFRPFVYGLADRPGVFGVYDEDTAKVYPIRFFILSQSNAKAHRHLFGVDPPGTLFLLGTDGLGRDQLSRLLYGGRISLFSGLLAAAVSLCLALVLGATAGYFGRWSDDAIMRATELFLALPWLYCLLAIRAFLPLHITPGQTFLLLVMVIGLRGWARPARLIRGIILSAKERDHVLAARGFGASAPYLIMRHVLPQTSGVLLTQAALLVPQYVLAEVTLSFLGLGVGEPAPTWGNMLAGLQHFNVLASYWWMYTPALALIPMCLAYYTLADAFHERSGAEGFWGIEWHPRSPANLTELQR